MPVGLMILRYVFTDVKIYPKPLMIIDDLMKTCGVQSCKHTVLKRSVCYTDWGSFLIDSKVNLKAHLQISLE